MKYLILALLVSVYFNYKLSEENSILEALVEGQYDAVALTKAAPKRSIPSNAIIEDKEFPESQLITTKSAKIKKEVAPEKIDDEEGEYYADMADLEMGWIQKIQDHLELNLELTSDEFAKYVKIRTHRQAERQKFFKEKFKDEENHPKVTFFTPEDNIALGKIDQKYALKLKELFGEQGYQSYTKLRDSFNHNNLNQDGNHHVIDF